MGINKNDRDIMGFPYTDNGIWGFYLDNGTTLWYFNTSLLNITTKINNR